MAFDYIRARQVLALRKQRKCMDPLEFAVLWYSTFNKREQVCPSCKRPSGGSVRCSELCGVLSTADAKAVHLQDALREIWREAHAKANQQNLDNSRQAYQATWQNYHD